MRVEDAPRVTVSVLVGVAPEQVWPIVCDLSTPVVTSPELKGARWLGGADGPALGARFEGRNENPALGSWTSVSTVTEYVPERRLAWIVGQKGAPVAFWSYQLDPAPGCRTRLSQSFTVGSGASRLTELLDKAPGSEEGIVGARLLGLAGSIAANLDHIGRLCRE